MRRAIPGRRRPPAKAWQPATRAALAGAGAMTTTRESGRDAGPVAGTALPKRMPTLDGIRGIGMVAVLVAHVSQQCGLSSSSTDNAMLKVLLRGG